MQRTKPISKGTLRYLESALAFFKRKYGLKDVSCSIEYLRHRDTHVLVRFFGNLHLLGHYTPKTNKIGIEGCDYRPRNELVKALFHELTHYWQYMVVKKLRYLMFEENTNPSGCQPSGKERVILNDWYHTYPKQIPVLYYDSIDVSGIDYWNRPHEIEARKVAEDLFEEWNLPENKGKI